jgi:predicted esterase
MEMFAMTVQNNGPHQGQTVLASGEKLGEARAAMILVHGRGATAESILSLASEFEPAGFAFLAPQAAENTWYPYPFTAPLGYNEPYLSSALAQLDALVAHIEAAGIPAERIILLGFSQGACLSSEFVARNARRYGGLAALSGGLIGPDDTPRDYPGSLEGTPVFLGCTYVHPHTPAARYDQSAEVLARLGGQVDKRLYRGMGHTVSEDEIAAVRNLMATLIA